MHIGGWLVLASLGSFTPSENSLDVGEWLARDGVRAVAVEFYATWCEPCMEAVPRWRALHEQYRERGFRLVVVNTREPSGACKPLGWNPDQTICDPEGRIAAAMGVDRRLPSAFLWNWQGRLLVQDGSYDQVENELTRFMAAQPRVAIDGADADGRPSATLAALLSAEMVMSGKVDVVSNTAVLHRLRGRRKASRRPQKREDRRCELGRDLSANTLLAGRVMGQGRAAKLSVALHSVDTGCLLTSQFVRWSPSMPRRSAREAISALMGGIRGAPEWPPQATTRRPLASVIRRAAVVASPTVVRTAPQPLKIVLKRRFHPVPRRTTRAERRVKAQKGAGIALATLGGAGLVSAVGLGIGWLVLDAELSNAARAVDSGRFVATEQQPVNQRNRGAIGAAFGATAIIGVVATITGAILLGTLPHAEVELTAGPGDIGVGMGGRF